MTKLVALLLPALFGFLCGAYMLWLMRYLGAPYWAQVGFGVIAYLYAYDDTRRVLK